MASRGSQLSRVRQYFRTADIDEVEVAFELVKRDLAERMSKVQGPVAAKVKRPRRTKAQIAQDKLGMQAHTSQPPSVQREQESLGDA
jgi:hypothetical protein